MAILTPEALRLAGLDALRRDLGATGMVRFLQQFTLGSGNYTAERWQWLPADVDVDHLTTTIEQETAGNKLPLR